MMAIDRYDDIVDALRVRYDELPCAYTTLEVCGPVAEQLGVDACDVADVIDVLLADGSLRYSSAGGGLLEADPAWLGYD